MFLYLVAFLCKYLIALAEHRCLKLQTGFASTFAHMTIAAAPNAEVAGNMGNLLFTLTLLFCGVLATAGELLSISPCPLPFADADCGAFCRRAARLLDLHGPLQPFHIS